MKGKIFLISAIIIALLVSITVTAQPVPKPPKYQGFNKERITALLKLTGEQQKKFNNFFFTQQNASIDLRADIQKVRLKIRKMMAENNVDGDKLLALTGKINQLQGKLKMLRTKFWLNVYKILNDSQREIWIKHFRHFRKVKHRKNSGHPMRMEGRAGFRKF